MSTSAISARPSTAADLVAALTKLKSSDGDADDTKTTRPAAKSLLKQGVGQIIDRLA